MSKVSVLLLLLFAHANFDTIFAQSKSAVVNYDTTGFAWPVEAELPQAGMDIAPDPEGNIFIATAQQDTLSTNRGLPGHKQTGQTFVSKYTPQGKLLWRQRVGDGKFALVFALASDVHGNVYLTGIFHGTSTFGDTTLTTVGVQDVFVASYSGKGKFRWARHIGSQGLDMGSSICTDKAGHVYATGSLGSSGAAPLFNMGGSNAYLAKYDSEGTLLWLHQPESREGTSMGTSVCAAGDGSVFLVGTFSVMAKFSNSLLSAAAATGSILSMPDGFIAKYSADGVPVWAKRMGGQLYDGFDSVVADQEGNVYASGHFSDRGADFEGSELVSDDQEKSITFKTEGIITKLSPDGQIVWIKKGAPYTMLAGHSLARDEANNLYLVATLDRKSMFDKKPFAPDGESDLLIVTYNADGTVLWIKQEGGPNREGTRSIAVSPKGYFCVIGSFQERTVLAGQEIKAKGKGRVFVFGN